MPEPESRRESTELARQLREQVLPWSLAQPDWGPLLEAIGEADMVLLGEATHGSHEFYAVRAQLTQRLIRERGFTLLAIEGDWPAAYRANLYLQGESNALDAEQALDGFARFPSWMWQNRVFAALLEWLREYNQRSEPKVGLYGIDLYSLHASMHAVLEHVERVAPTQVARARERYGCFDSFGGDPQRYGYIAARSELASCEGPVVEQLLLLQAERARLLAGSGRSAVDAQFFAEQNARVVQSAEQYYRAMYRGGISSWNLRDTHMADTVDQLCRHMRQTGRPEKVIVWAHNSHLGDARATELGAEGELNLGQLLRERHGARVFSLGFSTYEGQVTAASSWDQPAQQKCVRPGLPGSYEALFHELSLPSFLLLSSQTALREELARPRLQRAIGVIYRPETERRSHYLSARLGEQFDALLHVDRSSALEPLAGHGELEGAEVPETYPSGL